MKKEEKTKLSVADITAERTEELVDAVLSSKKEWMQTWTTALPAFYRNYVSDKPYRGGVNQFTLWILSLASPTVCGKKRSGYYITVNAAYKMGWKLKPEMIGLTPRIRAMKEQARKEEDPVKKKAIEKAMLPLIAIQTPIVFTKTFLTKEKPEEDEDGSDGEAEKKDAAEHRNYMLRFYSVYPIEAFETNGKEISGRDVPAEEKPRVSSDSARAGFLKLMAYCSQQGIPVSEGGEGFEGESCFYSPKDDSIHLPETAKFSSDAAMTASFAHECGHSTGAVKRLNRENRGNAFGDDKYSREELAAESCALFFSAAEGFADSGILENSLAYIKSFLERIKDGGRNCLISGLNSGMKASAYIEAEAEKAMAPIPPATQQPAQAAEA